MKTLRMLRKILGIFVGSLGVAALSSSCGKMHDCTCTYSGGGGTVTQTVSAGEKCDEMDREYTDSGTVYTIDCENS